MAEKKTGKEFEELVYNIYRELEPHADVRLNDFITGKSSKTDRQIDISIRSKIAGHEILIIQAKDLKRTGDVNVVGTFKSVIEDVGAQKGILICNTGFTRSAKEAAKAAGIDLFSAHDASQLSWQAALQVPVLKQSLTKVPVKSTYAMMGPTTLEE